ncbi:Glycoside hydrolase, family 20, catalytic core [Actinobacteria bacterium OK074]|nr:Glycoside hydrolase, family 20, catalytic core [Actinobacteria bacterium OK074]
MKLSMHALTWLFRVSRPSRTPRPTRRARLYAAVATALLLLAAPVPALAADASTAPLTVPALTNWTAQPGSYVLRPGVRIVAADRAALATARTLADDLRSAGHGVVPVVRGPAHGGDIEIAVDPAAPAASDLGAEGYQLRVGSRLSVTGATATGAFYGTRTVLQLLAQGDRIPAGSTVDTPAYKERGVDVCACYIHISLPWLENLVRDMAYHKLNQLLLELKVKSDVHPEANTWGYYTKDEIRRLVALGEKYHVEIIPEINSPGHMDPWIQNRPDLQLTDSDGVKQPARLDITDPAAFDYYKSLIDEYAEVFPATSWHMGADEYMLGSDFAKYPQILKYAQEKYGANATPQDAFIDFINRVQAYLASKGKKLRIWNDGLTGANTVPVAAGTTVEHWLNVAVKPSQLLAEGYPLMNASYSLYLVRGGFHSDTESLYDQSWDPRSFEGEKVTSSKGITGAKISLWPDNGRGETENEVTAELTPALRQVAQATWGDPHPDATYADFTARGQAVGHAPGRRDLTHVPVTAGTYTFTSGGVREDFTVRRTADGYASLTSTASGKCLETISGKLTINVPLDPGSSVTEETCAADDTLQRWEVQPAHGGYTLVNAITQMAVHIADDSTLVQYPPDQQQPSVWTLTPVV